MTQDYTSVGIYADDRPRLDELKRKKYNTTAVPTVQVLSDLISQELEDN